MSIQCPVNAISNANLKCKFPMQISNANFLYKPMQFPLHTCSQNKYTGAARQRRDKSFASSRPARCIGGVLRNTAQCCPEMPSAPTAPTAVLPPWQQTCSTCPAPGRSCSVLNHPYLVLPGDTQCSHSSHSSAPTAPTAVLPQLPQLPQLP